MGVIVKSIIKWERKLRMLQNPLSILVTLDPLEIKKGVLLFILITT